MMRLCGATLLGFAWAASLTGCGGRGASERWQGKVDTTASGTVVVSNPAVGIWDSATAWRLEEAVRIGSADGTGPSSFSRVRAIEVDRQGRIYVLESQPQEIRVFDSTGAFVRVIGRPGAGPGEFVEAIGLAWDSSGHLWVVDQRNARYTAFDTSGRHVEDRPRTFTQFSIWAWQGGIDGEGRFYDLSGIPGPEPRSALVRLDGQFRVADTIPLPQYQEESFKIERRIPGGRSTTWSPVAFAPRLQWVFDPRGYLWFSVTDRYRIYQRRLEGDTVLIVERAYDPVAVTAAEKDSAIAGLKWFTDEGGRVDRSRFPDRKPALTQLLVDDEGYLWVRPSRPAGAEGTGFDVFDPEGRYLGLVRTEAALSFPLLIRGTSVYAVSPDEDGVPYVVRLRILNRNRTSIAGTRNSAPTVPATVPPTVARAIAPNN